MSKPFVFVLMPFEDSFSDIYKFGIKEAVNETGGYCERVDEQIFEERILDRIYNQINKADVIIADLSGKNPNVFYETGYAHAIPKRVILLTQKSEDIPFDLRHHYHIVYDGKISKLKEELSKRLEWYFSNPEKLDLPNTKQLEFYIEGQKIAENSSVIVKCEKSEVSISVPLNIDIHNIGNGMNDIFMKIGFLLDSNFMVSGDNEHGYRRILINSNKVLFIANSSLETIYPDCWTGIEFEFGCDTYDRTDDIEEDILSNGIPITLKLFTEAGSEEVNFLIKIYYYE